MQLVIPACDYCRKTVHEVATLIRGRAGDSAICDECVQHFASLLLKPDAPRGLVAPYDPLPTKPSKV